MFIGPDIDPYMDPIWIPMWNLYTSSICKCVHSCSKMLLFHWTYVQLCQGDSGRPREHFGEGSGKVRKKKNLGRGKSVFRGGTEGASKEPSREPTPDPPVDISIGLL